MSSSVRNSPRRNAANAGAFIRRRLLEVVGLASVLAGLTLFVALASYDPNDPSLNTAANRIPENFMGPGGAFVADLFIQSIGLASLLLALTLVVWGWRLMRHRFAGRPWIRLASLPLAILFSAIALGGLASMGTAPYANGWGGAMGGMLFADLKGNVGITGWIATVTTGVLAAAALLAALGLSGAEWQGVFRKLAQAGVASSRAGLRASYMGGVASGHVIRMLRRADAVRSRRGGTSRKRLEPAIPAASPLRREPTLQPTPTEQPQTVQPVRKDRSGAKRKTPGRQGALDLGPDRAYELPPIDELDPAPMGGGGRDVDDRTLEQNARALESVLEDFGVRGEIVKVRPGPVVTLYELEPAPGTKSSRVIGLAGDIARSMSAVSVRVAVIPGRNVIGIELPNAAREIVYLRDLLGADTYQRSSAPLTLSLGKDIGGAPMVADLARMPHLLIAGTTGSGKSVAINTMVLSLLYRLSPHQCKFIMVDPKMLELSVYDGIPHLLAPVVTEPGKAVVALRWAVREMENRYRAMSNLGVRNIAGYNARLADARRKGETLNRTVQTGFDPDTGQPAYEDQPLDMSPLPFIVVIVDEMADLMLVAGKEVEGAVQRLSQMARAAGIHLIMATQRPSVDVITGTIKANFPTRVSFQVTSKIDSRTILGEAGAEQLLGQGDMLYMAGGGRITRVHGPLVTDDEVERVVRYLREQGEPDYVDEVTDEDALAGLPTLGLSGGGNGEDALYDQAVAVICRERKASTSFIQRHLQIGYNRAARIIERMEAEGVVSSANHVGKREVLARDIDDRTS